MAYISLTRLGDTFDDDSTLSTSLVYSDSINSNGRISEIQLRLQGDTGDTDDVEVYQYNSLSGENGLFDTEGKTLGSITLNGVTEVVKSFNLFINRSCKIGIKMEADSTETPSYRGGYTINDSVYSSNF